MTDTPGRLLRLLSLLQTPREWPGGELAERLRVSRRTVRRDVDRLRELGYPVEATMGATGGYRLVAGSATPPLLVDDEEAVAIAVGLRAAAGQAVAGIEEAALRALTKLERVLPARLRHRVGALGAAVVSAGHPGPAVDPEVLTALAAAVANHERVRFDYVAGDGARTSRLVEPLRLVATGRRWYLVAHDTDRDDWRTFRVDRVDRPRPTGVRTTAATRAARTLPAEDAAAYVEGRRSDWGVPAVRVVATFHAPVGEVAGRLGDAPGEVVPVDERSCRLDRVGEDSPSWLAGRMAALGCEFEVHEPPELVEHLRLLGERVTRATAGHR